MKNLEKIKMLLLDVDGVLTDGSIIYDINGVETKKFNVTDGHGIKMLQRYGILVGIITGRNSQVVSFRAKELGIDILYQGALEKINCYNEIKATYNLSDEEIAYIGDDVIDIKVLKKVGFSAAPKDALPYVLEVVDFISTRKGGRGAVREVIDEILKAKGLWEEVKEKYGM